MSVSSEMLEPSRADRKTFEVAVFWKGVQIDVAHFRKDSVTIGEEKENSFQLNVEDFSERRFRLAEHSDGGYEIKLAAGMRLAVRRQGRELSSEDLEKSDEIAALPDSSGRRAFRPRAGDVASVFVGPIELRMRYVGAASPLSVPFLDRNDLSAGKYFSMSFFGHLMFLIALVSTPRDGRFYAGEPDEEQVLRFVDLAAVKPPQPTPKIDIEKAQSPAPPNIIKRPGSENRTDPTKIDAIKRANDVKIATDAGIVGIIKKYMAPSDNIFSRGSLGIGINEALEGIPGTDVSDAGGFGGTGSRGTDTGGGGQSIGIGGLSIFDRGNRKVGGDYTLNIGPKGMTKIPDGKTILKGGLKKEEVNRVIRRHLLQVKHCYEKELSKNPNAEGKVSVYFEIGASGSVMTASVRETTMNNNEVESCILGVMRNLRFPPPAGGGIVEVTYPFIFSTDGK